MPQIPFLIGEASCFKEEIGRKHFWYLPARKTHEIKAFGHVFGVTELVEEEGSNMGAVLDMYYDHVEMHKPRLALKKAVTEAKIGGVFLLAVVHNRTLYFALRTGMEVLLMRKEEVRYLSKDDSGNITSENGIIFGEYPVMSSDRLVFCSADVTDALDVRELTDILCEYEENVASQELLKKTLERTTNDKVMVMAVKVNAPQKTSSIKIIRMGLLLIVIAAIVYLIYKVLFLDTDIPIPPDENGGKDTPITNVEYKGKNAEYIKRLEGKLPLKPAVKWEKTYASFTASPIVFQNTLYLAAKDSKLRAVSMVTHEDLWTADMAYEMGGTPAVDDTGIYIGTYKGVEYKLSLIDGSIVWRGITSKKIVAGTVVNDQMVFTGSTDSFIYAFNKQTGDRVWRVPTKGIIWNMPALSGTMLYAGSLDKSLYAIDTTTGKIAWRKQFRSPVYAAPAVTGTMVFAGTSNGSLVALDGATGNEVWSFVAGKGITGRITADATSVYFGSEDGIITVLDATTGTVRWSFKTNAEVMGGVVVSDGVAYAVSYDKFVYALDASNGNLLWKAEMSDKIYATPYLSGSDLIIADMKGLVRIFETDLKKLQSGTP